MKYVRDMAMLVTVLLLAGWSVAGWRRPVDAIVPTADRLWWHPHREAGPSGMVNVRVVDQAMNHAHRLLPLMRDPAIDETVPGVSGRGLRGLSETESFVPAPGMPLPARSPERTERYWDPDADAFDILGQRREGRQPGWLEQDVSILREAASRERTPVDSFMPEVQPRIGTTAADGPLQRFRLESFLGAE